MVRDFSPVLAPVASAQFCGGGKWLIRGVGRQWRDRDNCSAENVAAALDASLARLQVTLVSFVFLEIPAPPLVI